MKLLHLFPDLMNLYGDYGNLTVLKKALEDAGETVELVNLSPADLVNKSGDPFEEADFLYMGPGTEPARNAALSHLRPWADALKDALVTRQTPALFTGNAWSLLGQAITLPDGSVLDGLGLFDYATAETRDRYTGDAIALPSSADLPDPPSVGFLNRCDQVAGVASPLFSLQMGKGNDGGAGEGFVQGRFYATHLIGPLLVKNPHLLRHFAALLGVELPPPDKTGHPYLAYQVTLSALQARLENSR